jgi:hypothetical protein
MGYTHSKYEVLVTANASVASAGDIGDWSPGYIPHIIRAVAMVFTTVSQATGVTKVDKRPAAGSDTGRGDGDIATINYTAAGSAAGQVIYKDGLDIELLPGAEAVFQVTDATPTSGNAHLILYVEPRWETPANVTAMTATT